VVKLSVVIITLNQKEKLRNCINSIFNSNNNRQDMEVIIVDNNTNDEIFSVLAEYASKIKIIRNGKNNGVAPARNQGIEIANGLYVMMLDDDTEVKPGCFDKIIEFMDSNEDCWCLGTKQLKPDGSLEYNARTFYDLPTIIARRTPLGIFMKNKIRRHLMMDWDHSSTKEVDWVAGASFVMRKKAIEQIGKLDEGYFFGFEDVDWCTRVKLAGKKVYYLADAVVVHHVQGSSRKLLNKNSIKHLFSAIRYFKKFKARVNN
jgi:GT2 family glycosyltransferase